MSFISRVSYSSNSSRRERGLQLPLRHVKHLATGAKEYSQGHTSLLWQDKLAPEPHTPAPWRHSDPGTGTWGTAHGAAAEGGGGLPGRFLKRNHVSCLKRPSVSKGVGLGVPLPHFLACLQTPQSPGGREVSHGAHGLLASVTPEADPSRNGVPFMLEEGE